VISHHPIWQKVRIFAIVVKWGAFVLVEGAKDDSAVVLGDFC